MKYALLLSGLLAACEPQPTSDASATDTQTIHPGDPVTQKPVDPDKKRPVQRPSNVDEAAVPFEPIMLENEDHPAVTKIIYTEANGSLPPPSQYSNDFELTAKDAPNFQALVDAALDDTRVNDAVSLRGYMVLQLNGDPRAARVRAVSDKDVHPKGGQSNTVKFELKDGREFEVSNYAERLSGAALDDLKQAARAQGQSSGLPERR